MKQYKYSVFTDKIEEGIRKGLLKPGDKLPSVRAIKAEYTLSTSSVQSGYDYLVFRGLVQSLPRAGYIVAAYIDSEISSTALNAIPRDSVFREKVLLTSNRLEHSEQASLNVATPADVFIPQKLVLKTMQEVIREKGASLLRYYPNNGSNELRDLIASRAALYGTTIQADELVITDGALQALYIALASVTSPGDIVAVESPCVFSILEVFASLGLRTVEVPVRYPNGLDIEYLAKVCADYTIKAIVVTPNFHNPTGLLLTDEQKQQVYDIAVEYNVPIIENDIYGDLYFEGNRPSNIRSFDTKGLVLTYSSFSKTLAPGLRLGWLAAGKYFSKAERVKFSIGRSVSPINQEVMIKLLNSSSYDKHLRVFRSKLELQCIRLIEQFKVSFPQEFKLTYPKGGYSLWCQLPINTDVDLFYKSCIKEGVYFTPGETFSFTDAYDSCFRAVFSQQLTEGHLNAIQRIGEVLK